MDTWQPVTVKELESLIAAHLADCSLDQQQLPRPTPIDRGGNIESVFAVAQARDLVMYYEDVEEGFNISPLSQEGAIASPGYEQWELCHALKQLVAA